MSQIRGCDAVGCPVDKYGMAQCEVGNATLTAVGITEFTTNIDTMPLTWTVGLQKRDGPLDGSQIVFDRNYYLGTPASLHLANSTGCAIFFEGITGNLAVSRGNMDMDSSICPDVLSPGCISDLLAQVETRFEDLLAWPNDLSATQLCDHLREDLSDNAPDSCSEAKAGWGTSVSQSLTTTTMTEHAVNTTQCHPTTGQGYSLSLVTSQQQQATTREYSQLSPILEAITPIVTVFGRANDITANMACLNLVESKYNQRNDTPQESGCTVSTTYPAYLSYMAIIGTLTIFSLI